MTFRTGFFLFKFNASPAVALAYALAVSLLMSTLTTFSTAARAETDDSADQAKVYRETLAAIRKGHKTNTREGMDALAGYPLYPYLEKALLEQRLRELPTQEVDGFLDRYDGTVVASQLRKRWLRVLARKHQWENFIQYYQQDVANNDLRCKYLEALHQSGYNSLALSQTAELWLSGSSLPDSCDSVFERWQQAGLKTDALVWQRIQLAIGKGNTLLARYLSKRASVELKPYTRRMLSVHYSPRRLQKTEEFSESNAYTADIVTHGLTRLASRDPQLATDLWVHFRAILNLSDGQNTVIRDKIARQIIASGSEDAMKWLITQDPNAEDSYLLEWRIRLALRDQQWQRASRWISLLPAELQQQPRWRYWQARSLQESQPEKASALLASLSAERNYYGFLAADLLQKPYGLNHASINNPAQEQLADAPAIARAKTFYDMNELTSARREWRSAMASLDEKQLMEATQLAHRWGWHQQAIHTTIKAKHWDDLSIRFPLAYQHNMMDSAQQASIRLDWLYAITRQESAFAEDARSSADARGLMQLIPSTARQVAKSLGIHFKARDLYRADTNITLGSNYLKQLLAEFDGDHILATAAYNAGPHKVNQWLKNQSRDLPYDVWIETLPFHETRNYVQNVLAFAVIYGQKLGLDTPLWKTQRRTVNSSSVEPNNS